MLSLVTYLDEEPPSDGKIVFKKPAKRSSSDKFQGISASSSKKKKKHDDEEEGKSESKSETKVKNKSLLSFVGDDEDEDDWTARKQQVSSLGYS